MEYQQPRAGETYYKIRKGDRIAQAVLCPVELPELVEVESLEDTARGTGAYGSTGV
jgi:dUTP pyrophosphatase